MSQESVEVDGKTVCIDQPMIGKWPVNGNWHVKIRTAAAMMDRDGKQEQIDAMHPITQLAAHGTGPKSPRLICCPASPLSWSTMKPLSPMYRWSMPWLTTAGPKIMWNVCPRRMKAVGIVSRPDPARMIEQLEQCMELGFKSVTVRPEPIKGRYFGHKDNHPFFKACADNNIAVLIHSGSHLYGNTGGQ